LDPATPLFVLADSAICEPDGFAAGAEILPPNQSLYPIAPLSECFEIHTSRRKTRREGREDVQRLVGSRERIVFALRKERRNSSRVMGAGFTIYQPLATFCGAASRPFGHLKHSLSESKIAAASGKRYFFHSDP